MLLHSLLSSPVIAKNLQGHERSKCACCWAKCWRVKHRVPEKTWRIKRLSIPFRVFGLRWCWELRRGSMDFSDFVGLFPRFPPHAWIQTAQMFDWTLSSLPPLSFPGCNRASIPRHQRAMVSGHVHELALDWIMLPERVFTEPCNMYVTQFASPRSLRHWNFSAQAMADVFRTKFPGLKVTRSALQREK